MDVKGIVYFDYDGTLTDEKEGIFLPTQKTVEAVNTLEKNGYLAVLATGRAMCYVPGTGINFAGFVTSNGSYAEIRGKEIFQSFIEKKRLRVLLDKLDEMGLYYSLENQQKCYAKDIDAENFKGMLDNFKISADIFEEFDKSRLPDCSKLLLAYNSKSDHEELCEYFKDDFDIAMHRKFLSSDIVPKEINKSVGAGKLAEYLNISKENIYAFGDGTNDIDLFRFAGHPIAMGYHADILEEESEYITDTVKNEGIYKGLEHFGLI